jgi:hypothetical protein
VLDTAGDINVEFGKKGNSFLSRWGLFDWVDRLQGGSLEREVLGVTPARRLAFAELAIIHPELPLDGKISGLRHSRRNLSKACFQR